MVYLTSGTAKQRENANHAIMVDQSLFDLCCHCSIPYHMCAWQRCKFSVENVDRLDSYIDHIDEFATFYGLDSCETFH